MRTRVQRWGNSLGVRIPRAFAREAGLEPDAAVELTLAEGKITLAAVHESPTLEDLLAGVTPDNVHGEVSIGAPVGVESW